MEAAKSLQWNNAINGEAIKHKLEDKVPLLGFSADCFAKDEIQTKLGFDVINLDWAADPKQVRNLVRCKVALQSNLDPCTLYSDKEELNLHVKKMLEDFEPKGYIANLGHGIYTYTPVEAVKWFVDMVHSIKDCC